MQARKLREGRDKNEKTNIPTPLPKRQLGKQKLSYNTWYFVDKKTRKRTGRRRSKTKSKKQMTAESTREDTDRDTSEGQAGKKERGKKNKRKRGAKGTKRGEGGETIQIVRKADTGAYRHAKLPGWHHARYLSPKEGSAP